MALAFTIFGVLLQGNPQWLDEIKDYLNQTLPGFIQDGGTEGLIPLTIPSGDTLTVTGLIGLAGLLFAGLGWLGALRDGIRTIFGVKGEPGNFVTNKLRDLGVLVILGLAIVRVRRCHRHRRAQRRRGSRDTSGSAVRRGCSASSPSSSVRFWTGWSCSSCCGCSQESTCLAAV